MVLIVADEHTRTAAGLLPVLRAYPEAAQRQVPKCPKAGHDHGGPLRQTLTLSAPIAVENDVRIDSDLRVIDEYLAIHFADIDRSMHAVRNDRDRTIDTKWKFEIFGKVI